MRYFAMNRLIFLFLLFVSASAFAQPRVYVVEITGEIDLGLVPYVERVVNEASTAQADAVLIHVNTFGGRVDAATEIKDALLNAKMPTIAFVDKQAISAGAYITLSCSKIAMSAGSTMGAATPIYETGEKSQRESQFIHAQRNALARRNVSSPTGYCRGYGR